jgi:peptide/nickel transport system permease protein
VFIDVVVALAPWLAPYDPNALDLTARLGGPSVQHWLGTDLLGRDNLSRLMYGGRFSVSIAAVTLVLSCTFGTVIGAISGRVGGAVDEVAMRTVDILLAFPDVVFALFLIAIVGPGSLTVIVALSMVGWTPFARLTRALAIDINTKGYVEAATALGCSQWFIVTRHVMPNAMRPILALALTRFGFQLITVGSLSFLGLGIQPPASDWGSMLADGQPYMQQQPLLVLVPGITIFVTALSVTLVGKGLSRGSLAATVGAIGPTPDNTYEKGRLDEPPLAH